MTQRTLFPAIVIGFLFAIVLTFVDVSFLTDELATDPVATFVVNAVVLFAALTLYGVLMQKAAAAGVVEHPGRQAAGDDRGGRGGRSDGSRRGSGNGSGKSRDKGRSNGRNRGGKAEPGDKQEDASAGPREQGTIKWFSGTKGFGFIIREDGSEVFVHHRALRSQGRRDLPDGQAVSFVVVQREKGPQADDVELEGDAAGNRA